MDVNKMGCLAEYKFCVFAMENGFNVSMPLLDSSRYDCIIEKENKLFKVQVKSYSHKDCDPHNVGLHCKIGRNGGIYTKEEVDFFALWVERDGGFYIVPNDKPRKIIRLSTSGKYQNYFNTFAALL